MESYVGYIPPQAIETNINYYIQVSDSSGRIESSPLAGYHSFYALATEVCSNWLLGDLNNSGQIDILDVLILSEIIIYNEDLGVCCDSVADINNDGLLSIVDIIGLISLIIN